MKGGYVKIISYCAVTVVALMMTGCVQTRYTWNNYDQKLYNHYKSPAESAQFIEDLQEIIAAAEADGKVPPGVYAEYGYALYEKGNFPEAAIFFKKEQDKWPESKFFMAKMIDNAQKRVAQTASGEKPKEAAIAETPVPAVAKEVTK